MELEFLKEDITDTEKHMKLQNLKIKYLNYIKNINNIIHEYEIKIVHNCVHEYIVEREPGQYGAKYTYCKKCRLDKNGRFIH